MPQFATEIPAITATITREIRFIQAMFVPRLMAVSSPNDIRSKARAREMKTITPQVLPKKGIAMLSHRAPAKLPIIHDIMLLALLLL